MARINIEDSLLKDARFIQLMIKTGSRDQALGMVCFAFIVAQEYWKKGRRPIPREAYFKQGLSQLLIDVGLATFHENDGIYISGSSAQFEWLAKLSDAGRKGGLKTQGNISSKAKATSSKRKPPSLSPSPSLTQTQSPSSLQNEIFSENSQGMAAPGPAIAGPNLLIAFYCDAYKEKYKFNPPIDGKSAGLAKMLLKDFGLARSQRLVESYLKMNDKRFLDKRHDLATMKLHLNAIAHYDALGVTVTQAQLNQIDQGLSQEDQLMRIRNGKL